MTQTNEEVISASVTCLSSYWPQIALIRYLGFHVPLIAPRSNLVDESDHHTSAESVIMEQWGMSSIFFHFWPSYFMCWPPISSAYDEGSYKLKDFSPNFSSFSLISSYPFIIVIYFILSFHPTKYESLIQATWSSKVTTASGHKGLYPSYQENQ